MIGRKGEGGDWRGARWGLAVLLAVYFLLTHLYASKVPVGQGPDELGHLGYVQWLAAGRGIPVLGQAEGPQAPGYEAHQPPLYYFLCAPVYRAARAAGPEAAARAVRLLSALFGALAVLCGFALARQVWPDRPLVAWGVASFLALLPSNVALMAAVNNDSLMELVGTGFLLLCALAVGRRLPKPGLTLGAVAGLGVWVKLSCLVLWGVGPLALWLSTRRADAPDTAPDEAGLHPGPRLHLPRELGLFALAALAVSAPWFIRTLLVYGDPMGWGAFVAYFRNPPPPAKPYPTPESVMAATQLDYAQYWQLVSLYFLSTFLGILLGPNSRPLSLQPEAYWVFLIFAIAAGTGYVWARDLRNEPESRCSQWVLLAALGLVGAAYVRLNSSFFWAQARYVFLALATAACVWSAGLTAPLPRRYQAFAIGLAALYLLAMNLGLLYGPLNPGVFVP